MSDATQMRAGIEEAWQPRPGQRVRFTRGQWWSDSRMVLVGETATVVEYDPNDEDDEDTLVKLHETLMFEGGTMALVWVAAEDLAPVEEEG